jgi:glycerol-3-phosphate dehydrogenase (NAD(P)+)
MAHVAVIGAGAWGTALACHAARLGHSVVLWAREPEVVDEVNARHRNSLFLEGAELPAEVAATGDAPGAVHDADLVLLVPPSQHVRAVAGPLTGHLPNTAVVAVASKGIEEASLKLMSQVLAETLPELAAERLAFLSGPTFAREVAAGKPTDVVVASPEGAAAERVQAWLHAPGLRVYTSVDPIGVQVGGAIKNVMAIATGACDALDLGANARASLITRGLAEITRLGIALGAEPLTFLGLAGVGDLVLTCTGDLSRNRTLGKKVAEGLDPTEYLSGQRSVAEGFFTALAAFELAQKLDVDMPITEQVFHVLHRGRSLGEAIRLLVTRSQKAELEGITS